MEQNQDYQLMCEHIKKVLDAYRDMIAQENGAKPNEDYKEKFYRLVNHKNEVL